MKQAHYQSEVTNQAKFCFYSSVYLIKGDVYDLLCRMEGPAEAEPGGTDTDRNSSLLPLGDPHLLPPTFDLS